MKLMVIYISLIVPEHVGGNDWENCNAIRNVANYYLGGNTFHKKVLQLCETKMHQTFIRKFEKIRLFKWKQKASKFNSRLYVSHRFPIQIILWITFILCALFSVFTFSDIACGQRRFAILIRLAFWRRIFAFRRRRLRSRFFAAWFLAALLFAARRSV